MACSSRLEVPTFSAIHCCYSGLLIVLIGDLLHSESLLSEIVKKEKSKGKIVLVHAMEANVGLEGRKAGWIDRQIPQLSSAQCSNHTDYTS